MYNKISPFRRSSIRTLQGYLFDISVLDPDIPRVNPDGIFSQSTEDALIAFQKKYMTSSPSGRADFKTWQELKRIAESSHVKLDPPEKISPFDIYLKDGKVVIGDESDLVLLIKIMLRSISITYEHLEDTELNSIFDTDTENKIKHFQSIHGINATGEIDKITWNALSRAYTRSLNIE